MYLTDSTHVNILHTMQPLQKTAYQGGFGVWNFFRNPTYSKASIILLCCFFTKVFFSCVDPITFDMNYSKIDLEMIDNSGNPFYRAPSDTLYSDAVSIKLNLSDSMMNYYASNTFKAAGLFSFESVHATSPVVSYQAVHLIQEIRVFTVFDIDDTYRAGDDITDSILYAVDYGFGMYIMKEDAIKFANGVQPEPACSFMIFLKSSVKNREAQFSVEITLDDGSKLIGTTDVYPVIPSKL